MRIFVVTALLALAVCGAAAAQQSAPSPFPVQRGAAPPPPAQTAFHSAPPQGAAAGGIDFGQWRSADAATYASSFETQIKAREQGKDAPTIQADLQANGFACEQGSRLDCRIEVNEAQCVIDWYVVVDDLGVHPGYERVCAGARPS